MIKQLLNSVIAKYRDLTVSRRSIICPSLRLNLVQYVPIIKKVTEHDLSLFECCKRL